MSDATTIPDMEWCNTVAKDKGLDQSRCPFASSDRCPRYFQSLSLLAGAGSTAIDPAEDARLYKKWEHHHLWPRTQEQASSIAGPPGYPHIFSQFCPEVSFDAFGLFASSLSRYADDLDVELAHSQLGREGIPTTDWRWSWSQMTPLHYSDCSLYAPLVQDSKNEKPEAPMPPSKLERYSWIAGIVAAFIAAVLLAKEFWPLHPEHPKPVIPAVQQHGGDHGAQIGQISGGTVPIVNQPSEPKPSTGLEQTAKNRVFDLKANFEKTASSPNYFVYGTVSVTLTPLKPGQSNYLTVCFDTGQAACRGLESLVVDVGTNNYKFGVYEPDIAEWSGRTTDTLRACIDDAKRINDYYAMSLEDQAVREEPVCQKVQIDRPKPER